MAEQSGLTKRKIDAMRPGQTLWDDAVLGLGIRCRSGGAKTFVLKYRIGGRQRWLTLGRFGALTLDLARRQARKRLGEVANGVDPAVRVQADRRAGTVAELCASYQEAVTRMPTRRGRLKTPGTLAVEAGHIRRHILPLLGRRRVPDVTRRDVEKFQEQVAAGATRSDVRTRKRGRARVTGGQGAAARCLNTLGAIFAYSVKSGSRDDNPVHGVTRFKGRSAQRFLNPDEMAALGRALAAAEADQPQAVAIVRLLALTGARRNEIARLRWPHVDLHHGVLRLPASKTGERLIVLGQAARELIEALPRHEGTDLVFPPLRAGAYYEGTAKVWRQIRQAAGVEARLHDLRHHFASLAGELGYALPTIAGLLGHALPGVTGRYLHFADAALREAADRVAAAALARLEGHHGAVVKIEAARKDQRRQPVSA